MSTTSDPTTMNARTRREEILRLARASGLASVDELSRMFQVTSSTIRRDLTQLTQSGQLARTYGGAMPIEGVAETTVSERAAEAKSAKRAIARRAATEIQPGEHVFLDAGTTAGGALARELFWKGPLTVVTTSLTALTALEGAKDLVLTSTGGAYRAMSEAFVGPIAEAALETMTFDRVFLGTDGVDPEFGVCEATTEQSRLKAIVMSRAPELYVLAHGEKVGARPFHSWTYLERSWHLITDTTADERVLDEFRTQGVDVIVVDANPDRSP
ncbi:DeoR/GlpR family DNA-binding transcription regulator [Nocardioides sp.]|uniref:DeoR/GlpR family DNA-binding transcription regulator n=1 Tax=Nocardioides sp. TaxID=35761 RepID=UPI0031FF2963|nr:DeoR family transcriptional regulator [Nocardioides sp.]